MKAKHEYLYLGTQSFTCPKCGSVSVVKHKMTFTDGTKREECDSCFSDDAEARAAGFLNQYNSFILKKERKHKKTETVLPFSLMTLNY